MKHMVMPEIIICLAPQGGDIFVAPYAKDLTATRRSDENLFTIGNTQH